MQQAMTLIGLLLLNCVFLCSASAIELDEKFKFQKIDALYYSFIPTSIANARHSNENDWIALKNKPLNLGIEKRPVWIKFTVKNPHNSTLHPTLSIDNPLLNNAHIYHFENDTLLSSTHIGDAFIFAQRQIESESLLAKLTLPPQSETTLFIHVKNETGLGLRVPLTLWQPEALLAHKSELNLLYGLLIGCVFSLAVSSLILYIFSRKQYFIYAGAITLLLSVFLAYLCGFGLRFIHPNTPALQQIMIPSLLMFITLLFLPLQRQVCKPLNTGTMKDATLVIPLTALIIIFAWQVSNNTLTMLCIISVPLVLCYYLTTTTMFIRQNPSPPNIALLLATLFFFIVVVHFIIAITGLYSVTRAELMVAFIASFCCSFFLSYMVIKLFILQRDEQMSAQQALIAKNAVQDTLLHERLKLQEQTYKELESQVDTRTFELQVTLRELEEKNRELEQLNMEDPLTGIKNRRFFDKKLVMEYRRSRREQTPLSIIMLDVDKFKSINDTYGHVIGDDVIRSVSATIKRQLKRPLDEVARYGGEEFVVLLPNTSNEGACDIAERIRLAIANTMITLGDASIAFTISAGVYTSVPDDINHPETFTECADKALYFAKQQGRNQVVNFQTHNRSV